MIAMNRAEQQHAARSVIRRIVAGRTAVLQITPAKLAQICQLHGLLGDLPPTSSGMDRLWRDRLLEALGGRVWSIDGRRWRVRCPWGGNFRIEPAKPRWRK